MINRPSNELGRHEPADVAMSRECQPSTRMSRDDRAAELPRLLWRPARSPRLAANVVELAVLLLVAPLVWFPRPISPIALLLLPLAWLVRQRLTGTFFLPARHLGATAAFTCFVLLSLTPVVDFTAALPRLLGLLLGLAIMLAIPNFVGSTSRLHRVTLVATVGLGASLSLLGLFGTDWTDQKLLLPLGSLYDRLPLVVRGLSHMTPHGGIHPNQTAGALTPLIPLALALVATSPNWRDLLRLSRLLSVAVLGAMTLVLILTQSRGAYVGVLVGCAVVLGFAGHLRVRSKRFRAVASGILAMTGVAIVAVAVRLGQSWVQTPGTDLNTLPTRIELWQRGVAIVQAFPLTGVGSGQLSLTLHAMFPPVLISPTTEVAHVHSFLLQLAVEFGIPGAICVLLMLIAFFQDAFNGVHRRFGAPPATRILAAGFASGVLAFLVFGLTDAVVLGARSATSLWLVLGLGAALGVTQRAQREN